MSVASSAPRPAPLRRTEGGRSGRGCWLCPRLDCVLRLILRPARPPLLPRRSFHNHVTGRTLDRLTRPKPGDKPGLEKLKEDIGIGALGHRELLLDEIMEVQASKSEQAARFNRGRQQQRQLEKSEERELERMHMCGAWSQRSVGGEHAPRWPCSVPPTHTDIRASIPL